MKNIANLLFEAKMLKDIPRSGYHFLGSGRETIAEHSFMITFIAFVMSKLEPEADAQKLITMCLVHDLPEARTGDMNYVQKQYVTVDETRAIQDTLQHIPFGSSIADLITDYKACKSLESMLAHDADQLSFILELKSLSDIGYPLPQKWLPIVLNRLKTKTGKELAENIINTEWDAWWIKKLAAPRM